MLDAAATTELADSGGSAEMLSFDDAGLPVFSWDESNSMQKCTRTCFLAEGQVGALQFVHERGATTGWQGHAWMVGLAVLAGAFAAMSGVAVVHDNFLGYKTMTPASLALLLLATATGAVLAQDTAAAGLAGARPSQVGRFAPNAFGLFDVHGNVAEWVADCWVESLTKLPSDASPASRRDCPQRALRDAAWNEPARAARVSARRPLEPDVRRPGIGFRVARDL